jgi:superfamily I DNA and/or RNA helicase
LIFNDKGGAVYHIKPSLCYYISNLYKQKGICQENHRIVVQDGELHPVVLEYFTEVAGLEKIEYDLHFKIDWDDDINAKIQSLADNGIVLPALHNDTLTFHYSQYDLNSQDSDPSFEVTRIKRILKYYFSSCKIDFSYSTHYKFDSRIFNTHRESLPFSEDLFWSLLYDQIHGDSIQISQGKQSVSFDFFSEKELFEKLNFLKTFPYIEISDWEEGHRFKFQVIFQTGLHELKDIINTNIPTITTKLIANGKKLVFRKFYKTGDKGFILDNLRDQLNNLINNDIFLFTIDNVFQEKYLCEENFDLQIEQEEEKLLNVRGEDFYFGTKENKYFLGSLRRIDYPEIEFYVEPDKLDEVITNISLHEIKAIFPDLKGEKDKIARLLDTLNKLESKEKLPNDNVKQFLFDSSFAKSIDDIDYLLNKESHEWKHFEENIYSKQLNESQKQAIFKSLFGQELVMIQGPPGTGKSTAIAEIIWHHILRNQKEHILLSSETNLAVDNAIDRLKNLNHNLVKPIRFGSDDKLESEGRFYSLLSIDSWVNGDNSKGDNAVNQWMNNIVRRVDTSVNHDIEEPLGKWKNYLVNPSKELRELFRNKYLRYTNTIGATGSSIGKRNSEGKFTSFFHSYLKVFHSEVYYDRKACKEVKISFDTVIIDEASKATPPELALPVIYGKKAIIVGDHRQLPPIVDDEEMKGALLSIGEKKLALTLSRDEFKISQFERLIENIDNSLKGVFTVQYRMHSSINNVISQFYEADGGLSCGLSLNEEDHKSFFDPMSRYHGLEWSNILHPHIHVLWIDTNTPEAKEGTSRVNFGEVKAVGNVLQMIKSSTGFKEFQEWLKPQPIEEKQIGVISFYGKQIKYLTNMIKEAHNDIPIRVSTVDRFQGMERNIIIVSLVRSNIISSTKDQPPDHELYGEIGFPRQDSLGFAEFPNRLNVALSRARRLLIIVGNSEHFRRKPIYDNVYKSIKESEFGLIVPSMELDLTLNMNG